MEDDVPVPLQILLISNGSLAFRDGRAFTLSAAEFTAMSGKRAKLEDLVFLGIEQGRAVFAMDASQHSL